MKVHVPKLIKFISSDGKYTLIVEKYENVYLEKNNGMLSKNKKIPYELRITPSNILSLPNSESKFLSIGGPGDSGLDLGLITIFDTDGSFHKIELKNTIKNLESLSKKSSMKGNFPWLNHIDIDEKNNLLKIWACKKINIQINLNDFKVTHTESTKKPHWVPDGYKLLSDSAVKLKWEIKNID